MWVLVPIALLIFGLVLLGIVAAFVAVAVAVVSHLFPVLLIVGGIWLLMKAATGSDARHRARRNVRAQRPGFCRLTPAPVARRPAQQRPAVWPQAAPPRRDLPLDVQIKADQIRHKVSLLLS